MASLSKVTAMVALTLAITIHVLSSIVESRRPILSKKDDGSDYYGDDYDYGDYSALPPDPEGTEKSFLKNCTDNIPRECEEAIIKKIFRDHSLPIAERCCRKLVAMGFECHLYLAFASDEPPKPPFLNDTVIVEGARDIFDKCVLISQAPSPAPTISLPKG